MNQEQLDELIDAWRENRLSDEQADELNGILRESEDARRTFAAESRMHGLLHCAVAEEVVERVTTTPTIVQSRETMTWANWSGIAIALGGIAIGIVIAVAAWQSGDSKESPGETIRGIARVIRIEGEGQAGESRAIVDNEELFAGDELALKSGLIELAFRETGVHVVATAPLRIKLDSNQRVSLHEGQIKLVVPPQGVGFVVNTAKRRFVDLGTSFVVTSNSEGSEVLVLDGQISVNKHDGESEGLMHEGEFAKYDRNGKVKKRTPSHASRALPELSLSTRQVDDKSLRGVVLGYGNSFSKEQLAKDVIGRELSPLIQSGFKDHSFLEKFKQGVPLGFRGIAGAFHEFPDRNELAPYFREGGWMVWYNGQVLPPQKGRYRFWGYADNHLLVAIDGKPVFEGSRRDSSFKELGIPRTNNPALPCLISRAGFACSDWIELNGESVQLDILFGDVGGNITSGLLLVEREGDNYEETFWGQPKWPIFLTQTPSAEEFAEFNRLVNHMERKIMGSFSIAKDSIWKVQNQN